ncbi:transglutaminase N-terminal domain-containing protein [Rufibacter sp. LB8]|uniref:transglutaminase N-terminal domain-containing protein n=1 Tax=Rufibacter sp. LB8 TaxID=2777781 RepID=UPI00178C39ED|nr:transglutaminase N-terminal domain-containing protein [Rufibacter sp. LB8]
MTTVFEITYSTQNTYEENVREAFFSFLVAPSQDETQSVRKLSFHHSLKAEVFHHRNSFGFDLTRLYSTQPFKTFEFQMQAVVEKKQMFLPSGPILSLAEEQNLLADHDFFIENHLFLGTSRYTALPASVSGQLFLRAQYQSVFDYLT